MISKIIGVFLLTSVFQMINPTVTYAEPAVAEILKEEDLSEELWYDDLELLAQIVEAEAGNQDLTGRRLVVDVVLNRVEDERFPGTIREVIYQRRQFSCLYDGNFERAGESISELSYEAVRMNAINGERLDTGILYFSRGKSNGTNFWKYGDHYFSY